MSFLPYATYKDSGVAWLGAVPGHWEINSIKRGYEVTLGKMLKSDQTSPDEKLAPYLRSANVQWGAVDVSDIQQMWFAPYEVAQLSLELGDLVVCEGGDAGRAGIWAAEVAGCHFQNSVNRVRSNRGNSTKYLMYWLAAMKEDGFIDIVCNKATIAHLTKEKLMNLSMVYAPQVEQQAIADYLDTETARIDALIQEKERLIRLLGERRSGVFETLLSESAISLGGRPSNRFPWLSVIPSTWTCLRVKHIVQSFDQGISPQCEARVPDEHEWGVLKVGCVNSGVFNAQESKALPPEIDPIPEITLHEGDVLVSRANTKNLVGRAAMADKPYPHLMLSDKLYRLKLDRNRCNPAFLVGFLTLPAIRVRIEERATGASASMLNIDRRTILELDLPLPPIAQQKAIVMAADRESAEIRDLAAHVTAEITLLKELRAATITDAVLGRVDVRTACAL